MQTSFTHFLRVLDASIWITAVHLGKGKLGVCILMVTLQTDSLCLLKPHTKGRDTHNTSLKHAPRCHILQQPMGSELRQSLLSFILKSSSCFSEEDPVCESERKICTWANGEEFHHVTLGETTVRAFRDLGVLKSWF